MEYEKLIELIESDKRLGSTTEYCAVACATGDLPRAPEPYRDIERAWSQLDVAQRRTVNQYRAWQGMECLKVAPPPHRPPHRPADKSKHERAEAWRTYKFKIAKGFTPIPSFLPGQQAFKGPGSLYVMVGIGEWDGQTWLHVSLSHPNRIPSYGELKRCKECFVGKDKKAIQVFPPESEHVNINENCLHLWHRMDADCIPDFTKGMGTI